VIAEVDRARGANESSPDERNRRLIVTALTATLCAVVMLSTIAVLLHKADASAAAALISPLVALVGTIVAYYFRRHSDIR
jgi:hypothetical protein